MDNEIEQRLANMIRIGTIQEVDLTTATASVKIGTIKTAKLPWMTQRSGDTVTWWAPDINEQVLVLSPSGDLGNGVILGSIYKQTKPSTNPDIHLTKYKDGTQIEYNQATHTLTINCVGNININGTKIGCNGGTGVVTGESICHFTGAPHGDVSSKVTAGK